MSEEKTAAMSADQDTAKNEGASGRDARKNALKEMLRVENEKMREAGEIMASGRGVFRLERPIPADDREIAELSYDFMALTGEEYARAMDGDMDAQQIFKITYRQALELFAAAAAKQTEGVDSVNIIDGLGAADASQAVQLAMLFFTASTRAARMRISRK